MAAESRLAIHELISLYADAFDEGRIDQMVGLFAPDGAFEVTRKVIGLPPLIQGQDELRAFMTSRAAAAEEHQRQIRHFAANIVVHELDETSARASSYLLLAWIADGKPAFPLTGRYVDELVLVDGAWRFARRVLTPDGAPPHDADVSAS